MLVLNFFMKVGSNMSFPLLTFVGFGRAFSLIEGFNDFDVVFEI